MWSLVGSLLFATAVFAQQYDQRTTNVPMDFKDDIYNRDMRGPTPDRLVFNFEQRRIDQPPQFEMRDENLRQYMGRPRTTPAPLPPAQYPLPVTHHHPLTNVPLKPVDPKLLGPNGSHLPATLPPAPNMPKWMDLSDTSFKNQQHHVPNRHLTGYYEPSFPTQQQPEQGMSAEDFVRPKERGNHKFNWADVTVTPQVVSTTTVATVPIKSNNPPASFPTLSPWHGDRFGK
ncbi:unnamed protein product [Diatraea saccharalis]|uniref:Uncharacterized protein n=1 Tax=Diatraea saccharalis TaxID=40085 RepID=A0A9N9WB89_9NEOP|nr:unnamed protein product [Diatraea saccharalis]